jgi:alpha-beta hydrolase superfamily lysophospholipase
VNKKEFLILSKEIPVFEIKKREFSKLEESYFSFYGLNEIVGEHFFGSLPSLNENIAVHYFRQADSSKTAIIMHGYYTHAGYTILLAKHLASLGYNLICYDMMGHGLSTGDRLEVDSFTQYTDHLIDVLEFFKRKECENHKLYSFGHSTGAVPIFDAALRKLELGLEKSFLLAPLIRTNHYKLSRISFMATKRFIPQIKRKFRRSSHDEGFLNFIVNDPLQDSFIPSSWLNALFTWNDEFEKFSSGEQDIIVIQGDQDGTVEWQTNLDTIRKKFTNSKIYMIEDAEHQLMNESPEFMIKVLKLIDSELP